MYSTEMPEINGWGMIAKTRDSHYFCPLLYISQPMSSRPLAYGNPKMKFEKWREELRIACTHTWLLAVVARVLHYHLSLHALDFHSAYTHASAVDSTAVASFFIISQHGDSQSSGNFLLVSSWRIGCMLLAKDLFTAYGNRRSATTRKL